MFGCRSLDPLLDEIFLDNSTETNNQPSLSPSNKIRIDAATQTNHQLKLDEPLGLDASALSNASTNSTLSSVGSVVDESSALDNIIALGLEMEQRAAQAKAEAQQIKNRHQKPQPLPLIMQQQPPIIHEQQTLTHHCMLGYPNFYNFGEYPQNNNFSANYDNTSSPPIGVQIQRGTQSAGPMHRSHFAGFFEQQSSVQDPSPLNNSYNT